MGKGGSSEKEESQIKKWKSLLTAAVTAVFAGAILVGCGGDSGSSGGALSGGSKSSGPAAPKKAVTQLKFNGKDVPLYEYKGEGIPKLQSFHTSLAVTKDYVVFYASGFMRVFNKKDGKYVGDIELKLDKHTIAPAGVTVDDTNNLFFIDDKTHIYRIDL